MTYNSSVNNLNQSVCKTTLTARIRVESASLSQSQTTQPEMCTVVTLWLDLCLSTRLVRTWNPTFSLTLQTEISIGTNLQSFFVARMIGWLAHHTLCDGKRHIQQFQQRTNPPQKYQWHWPLENVGAGHTKWLPRPKLGRSSATLWRNAQNYTQTEREGISSYKRRFCIGWKTTSYLVLLWAASIMQAEKKRYDLTTTQARFAIVCQREARGMQCDCPWPWP